MVERASGDGGGFRAAVSVRAGGKGVIYGSVCSGVEVGRRFGRLTVADIYAPRRPDQFRILCKCDCGKELDTTASRLRNGSNKSCGCFRRDRAGNLYRSHGKSQTPEYTMFYDARKRAIARALPFTIAPDDVRIPEKCPVLGITLTWDGPRDTRPSLDRIKPAAGYTPENIQVISFRANRIKSDATAEELRAVLAYVEAFPC